MLTTSVREQQCEPSRSIKALSKDIVSRSRDLLTIVIRGSISFSLEKDQRSGARSERESVSRKRETCERVLGRVGVRTESARLQVFAIRVKLNRPRGYDNSFSFHVSRDSAVQGAPQAPVTHCPLAPPKPRLVSLALITITRSRAVNASWPKVNPPVDRTSLTMTDATTGLIAEQQEVIAAIRRTLPNFKKTAKVNLTESKVRGRLSALEKLWDDCRRLQVKLIQTASDEERRTCGYFKDQEFLAAEEAYHEAVDHLHEAFGKFSGQQVEYKNTSTDSSCRDATAAAPMQLPRINLPKFNGKLTEWANFKGIFETLIADNDSLTAIQKLHYLKACVAEDAARLINNIQISESGYDATWRLLVDEYDNSFAIVTAHIRAFADMLAMRSESAAELKNLRDTASASLAALACMGRPVDTWDDLLVYIISRKFSDSTRREWNLRRGDFKDCPTYRDLSDFMTNRVRGLTAPPKYTEGSTPSARNERLRGSVHTVNSGKCAKCVGTHALHKCPSFLSQPIDSRWQTVKRHKLCCNCLRNGHFSSKCPTTSRCFRCKRAHHSTLHRDTAPSSEPHGTTSASDVVKPANQDDSKNSEAATVQSVAPEPSGPGAVLLATAWVSVKTAEGRTFQTRALLDQGSTFSFISEAFCQLLRTRRYQVNLPIRCFGEKYSGSARSCVQLKLSSRFADKPAFSLLAYSYQRITAYAASRMRPLHEWSHLRDLQLADPDPSSRHPIHLLIGADLYGTLLRNDLRQGPTGSPTAQATALGWIISGPTGPTRSSVAAAARFWTDEDIPSSSSRLTADEEKCENFFLATHSRDDSGRYTVRLPFKTDTPPEIEYAHFLKEYENLSHLEMVPLSEDPTRLPVYIPHHPVLRVTNTTTKLRVVFNASCRTSNGTSLNDHLLIGQKLQQDLAAILLRWRMFKVVCSADIEKMFRQIRIHTLDADYQRILWQPPGAESPHSYRLLTVTYGTASAPYLAMRVLRQLMADEGSRFPKAAAVLDKYIYVDDVLIGADTVAELIETRDQLIAMMNCGGFPLRKWSANTPDALRDLPAEIINAKQLSFEETGI
ncbi:uncharacterized protein [Linepithema humile]|uniref:uncharacterized protein n=1 Tax=Linepithema humile TaxID=83485 RepID=UPI00351ED6D4